MLSPSRFNEMANTNFKSVDEYIASRPVASREILERVRSAIRKAVPHAAEVISYQMPAYKIPAGTVLFFAGWKQHYSLYPAIGGLVEAFQKDLARYKISKGTIRFPLSEPVPVKLIERLAKFRAKEVAASEKAKTAGERSRQARKKL